MMDINVDLLQWFINFLIKKTSGCGNKNKNISDKKLLEELHKPIMRKYIHVLLAIFGVPI